MFNKYVFKEDQPRCIYFGGKGRHLAILLPILSNTGGPTRRKRVPNRILPPAWAHAAYRCTGLRPESNQTTGFKFRDRFGVAILCHTLTSIYVLPVACQVMLISTKLDWSSDAEQGKLPAANGFVFCEETAFITIHNKEGPMLWELSVKRFSFGAG